jgi:hypothetical protein
MASLLAEVALGKTIEKNNNEIKFDNFIVQAKSKNILTLIPDCSIEKKGWFGNKSSIKLDDKSIKDAYLKLYDYLVKKEIITKKLDAHSLITVDYVYTVNTNLIEIENLKNLINKDNTDIPELLKCYTINHEVLSTLLKNYNHELVDEVNLLVKKGGKPKKTRKNKPKKRKTRVYKK